MMTLTATSPFYAVQSAFPPSFDGQPLTYMLAVFGLLLIELLALEWLWRLTWSFRGNGRTWRHPLTIQRGVTVLLLLPVVFGGVPDLLLLMLWAEIDGPMRETLAMIDRLLDGVLWLPFSLAWLLAQFGQGVIEYQLVRHPLPVNLWPTRDQLSYSLKIGLGVFTIAFAVTFLR